MEPPIVILTGAIRSELLRIAGLISRKESFVKEFAIPNLQEVQRSFRMCSMESEEMFPSVMKYTSLFWKKKLMEFLITELQDGLLFTQAKKPMEQIQR